jgi:hypothetical protein
MKKTVVWLIVTVMLTFMVNTVWAAQDSAEIDPEYLSTLEIGQQNQPGQSLIITELQAGAIESFVDGVKKAVITMELPAGVTWARLPEIQVCSGDLELGTPYYDSALLTIPVQSSSSAASTIEISEITYTVDRTMPQGTVLVKLGGNAIVQSDFNNRTDLYIGVAECITSVPETRHTITIKIGSPIYQLGNKGTAGLLKLFPCLINGQTFMATRDLADLLGLQVKWDGECQEITLIKEDTAALFTIEDMFYQVNGEILPLREPMTVNQGYTMLPVRLISDLFGSSIGWDGNQQSLIIEN